MSTPVTEAHEGNGVTALVKDIITDAQELTRQQLEMFKVEIRENLEKAKGLSILLVSAMVAGGVATLILAMAAGQLLAWAFPALPLWGGYAIVGGLLAVVAGILYAVCKQKLDACHLFPEQAVEAMKENLEWKTESR